MRARTASEARTHTSLTRASGSRHITPGRTTVTLILMLSLALGGCREAPDAVLRIVIIPKGLTHEFWQSILRGAQRAARDLQAKGIPTEIIWDGPLKENDSLAQIRIVDRRIAAGVDGIVLAPQHSRTMVAPVERASQHGIPVVIIDSGLHPLADNYFTKYVATDNENGGYLAARHLLHMLRDVDGIAEPRLILFRYQVGSESTEKRERGFERYVEEEEKTGRLKVQWLSKDRYAGATRDTAKREASPLLQRLRGQIDGIFAPNESSANGMLDALRSLDMHKKVRLVGFDSSEPLLKAVEAGDIEGLILQDPYKMGYLSVWTLVHHIKGYDVNDRGRDRIRSTGENLITAGNLHDISTRQLFDPQLQEERNMEQPSYPVKSNH